ncbi:hypothetical protein DDB_G0288415 [Dictyostelium discoideum AX4]|uniref:Uncharacterized protein n=1 Tax=Dictyostelium discoideum TaxID=44689 RepID=Q54IZ1_DICDI|nr:hypothetical protein DDB_G0288415 [Dictyostelium discoideum AX4]EAL63233.1 hypothetical protein DDB_G0288415 [Dictyostelium discoideum AX4]|eukprot:XP_636739.1 hypothetical protein DDB_G0288415 [Dictyostelium discoideum AX4]
MGPRAFQIISILVGGFKEENSCYFNYTPRLENNSIHINRVLKNT